MHISSLRLTDCVIKIILSNITTLQLFSKVQINELCSKRILCAHNLPKWLTASKIKTDDGVFERSKVVEVFTWIVFALSLYYKWTEHQLHFFPPPQKISPKKHLHSQYIHFLVCGLIRAPRGHSNKAPHSGRVPHWFISSQEFMSMILWC